MSRRSVSQILDRDYLELRGRLLELAAAFDRAARGTGVPDPRLNLIREGIGLIADDQGNKAERVQLLFSRSYSPGWRSELGVGRTG
jgi:hypothetical protein